MSSLSKIIAGVLLAAGLVLAFVAWRPVSYTHLRAHET